MVPLLRTKHTYSRSSYPAASSASSGLVPPPSPTCTLRSPVFLRTFAVAYFSASWCKRACKLAQSQDRQRWSRTLGFLVCPVARSWACISQKSCHGTTVPWTRCHRSLASSSLTNSPDPRIYRENRNGLSSSFSRPLSPSFSSSARSA